MKVTKQNIKLFEHVNGVNVVTLKDGTRLKEKSLSSREKKEVTAFLQDRLIRIKPPKAKSDKPVRYTTLVRQCGQPVSSDTLTQAQYVTAVKENRVVCIHHDDGSNRGRNWAAVGHHIVNVLEHIVFPAPLPVDYNTRVYAADLFFSENL
ncbi:MAG TPA: hypothetical protein VHG89_04740 [Verrucomicrobiae bacterium]|nr:hypothetical protein [Verrucomicrobiae bacterium]